MVVLAVAALRSHSVALAGFGLDSLIEIGASTVVLWELAGTGEKRQRRGRGRPAAALPPPPTPPPTTASTTPTTRASG